ncbi:MAG: hypothetical protein OXI33_04220 [Chloroflexota bacterium]|nr:hypothetical protein [Chloroflexota bacterium]
MAPYKLSGTTEISTTALERLTHEIVALRKDIQHLELYLHFSSPEMSLPNEVAERLRAIAVARRGKLIDLLDGPDDPSEPSTGQPSPEIVDPVPTPDD